METDPETGEAGTDESRRDLWGKNLDFILCAMKSRWMV